MKGDDARTTVSALFAMAGVTPSAAELERLIAAYPGTRAMIAKLYDVPGVRYEVPAVRFDVAPRGHGDGQG